jgi:hypothetical protein
MPAHVAACRRQCVEGIRTDQWFASVLLAVRLSKDEHTERDALKEFRSALAELSSDKREAAFWAEDAFLSGLRQVKDAWNRLFDLSERGGIQLNSEKDRAWIRRRLSDPGEDIQMGTGDDPWRQFGAVEMAYDVPQQINFVHGYLRS